MSFVTKEVWSPGGACLDAGGACASAAVTMRNAFLRVPPEHEYAVATMTNASSIASASSARTSRPTRAAGEDRDTLHTYCAHDADCGAGGSCDVERNVCVGGLTADRGETDFLSFYMSRQNLFSDSLTEQACVVGLGVRRPRYRRCEARCEADDAARSARASSRAHARLDPATRPRGAARSRCASARRDRSTYRLEPHFPPYLVRERSRRWRSGTKR